MTIVVGYVPHTGGRGSLDLGMQLAHALGESLAVVTVVPRQWSTPSLAKVDAEYAAYARQLGEWAEARARAYLAETSVDIPLEYCAVTGRSVSSALQNAVEEAHATMLVLGSSTDGQVGRIAIGTTTDKLLHSAPVPLAVSPREFRSVAAEGVTRVTCAFSDSESATRVVGRVAELAVRCQTPLRVASFGVRKNTMFPPVTGLSAEDSVLDSWAQQAGEAQARLVHDRVVPPEAERVIATGGSWGDSVASIPWQTGELLALGSSDAGPLARVFLGSRAAKLIRHSPVPVVVLPREALRRGAFRGEAADVSRESGPTGR